MKTITTLSYIGDIAQKGYIAKFGTPFKRNNCTSEFIKDFDKLLDDLKWSDFDGFKLYPRMNTIEIVSGFRKLNEQIIKDNPNFNYLGSGDKDMPRMDKFGR